jgi:protein-tyrosine phosphatase
LLILVALQSGSTAIGLLEGWLAANLMALSIAYFKNWPGVFGKTKLGTLRLIPVLFMTPVLLVTRLVWTLQNAVLGYPIYHESAPDLFVGRICGYKSLPQGTTLFIDLTAEFETPRSIRSKIPFVCVTTLDGCSPSMDSVQKCFEVMGAEHQRVYVCCAKGYGRSVTLMAAWLGHSGRCSSASDAVALIQASRQKAAPNGDQMSFLTEVFRSIAPEQP